MNKKNHALFSIIFILLWTSCCNHKETNQVKFNEEIPTEDVFLYTYLKPENPKCLESDADFNKNYPLVFLNSDTAKIIIECYSHWVNDASTNPHAIRIADVDTLAFHLLIINRQDDTTEILWVSDNKHTSDYSLLKKTKSIVLSSNYYLSSRSPELLSEELHKNFSRDRKIFSPVEYSTIFVKGQ